MLALAAVVAVPVRAEALTGEEALIQAWQSGLADMKSRFSDPSFSVTMGDPTNPTTKVIKSYEEFVVYSWQTNPDLPWFKILGLEVVAGGDDSGPAPMAVVQVTSSLSVLPAGTAQAITFNFPKRNVQSPFSELDSVRIPTMKNAETGEECWLGASQMTVEEKKITISESVISRLTPGKHKIEFIFSDYAHAIAEITVLDASNFDGAFYAKKYPDVQASVGNDDAALFNHYAAAGFAEKRAAQIKVKK